MMSAASQALRDDNARIKAIREYGRSLLIEAGAGSGKTAVMAGRIAWMLADGVAPRSIAAVTFTELAAAELLSRVREVVAVLAAGEMPAELRIALDGRLTDVHRANLAVASAAIDEITCSTIHGLCQRLIKPYPAEADIDPGASIMDRNQGDLVFGEIVDTWLRERLSDQQDGFLAEMVLYSPEAAVKLVHTVAENLRQRRTLGAPPASSLDGRRVVFDNAVADFESFVNGAAVFEPETVAMVQNFVAMATGLVPADDHSSPKGLVCLLVSRPHEALCTQAGKWKAYRKATRWREAAKKAGLSAADGDRMNAVATGHYTACCDAWSALLEAAAGHALSALIDEVRPVLRRYREYKRASAQLDFDDLLYAARDLLRDHEDIRRALAQRFSHVLVDEFQDTDPLQAEIFWRLCGEPVEEGADWASFRIRPGALFLVGDPKQAIYRFRGADVGAYVQARDAFRTQEEESVQSISTNFRSSASILNFVNDCFASVLSADGQPGFIALDPFHEDRDAVAVAALDVAAADENGKATADRQRDAEAEAVADLCARMIHRHPIFDRRRGVERLCQPGDIALLAPTGTDLWRYEEALERRGIPVATQAGKGFFRRQEVQDLIALTRVLADRRDRLALGALLRGPIVGLSEEELLDIVWSLPRQSDDPERNIRLDLGIDAKLIQHPLARDVLERLQTLARRRHSTTPHELLSQAVDVMRVRPILMARHQGQAERALANVDLYLSLATTYAVRGLGAFADAMTAAWNDETRAVEGRPDAQEEAVSLVTMHAAKGLEWPIVIPVNTMTSVTQVDDAVIDRGADLFYCSIFGCVPEGYQDAWESEKAELERERVRLWYVATTRARELLILPRLDLAPSTASWIRLVDLSIADLPGIDLSHLPADVAPVGAAAPNAQTRTVFAAEAAAIVASQKRIVWRAPSRDEGATAGSVPQAEATIWVGGVDSLMPDDVAGPLVQGGRDRGLVLHKLMEEVLTGEVGAHEGELATRAVELIRALGREPVADAVEGLSSAELAACVVRTLALPEVAALVPALEAEFPVYGAVEDGQVDEITTGVVDAVCLAPDRSAAVVVDWKSDVSPSVEALEHYRAQVRAYLDLTGATRGLIVFMTTGRVVSVERA